MLIKDSYQLKTEVAASLKAIPGLKITDIGTDAIVEIYFFDSVTTDSCCNHTAFRLPLCSDKDLVRRLFQELAHDKLDRDDVAEVIRLFKAYLVLAKRVDVERSYSRVTPFVQSVFSLIVMSSLLMFPVKLLTVFGLIGNAYALGFWGFSVWSLHKSEQRLSRLREELSDKINALPTISFSRVSSPTYAEISESGTSLYTVSQIPAATSSSEIISPVFVNCSPLSYFYSARSLSQSDEGTRVQVRRCSV